MPARNFPIIVIQLKFNQKLCHLPRHAPPDASLSLSFSLFCHAMPKIKDDKSEGKVMEIGAIICQRQGPQPTTAQTHTQTYTHTHTHTWLNWQYVVPRVCTVTKITERQAKMEEKLTQKKKIIFTFTMTMSLCCRPATPSLSLAATLMVCEINRQRERVGERGRGR